MLAAVVPGVFAEEFADLIPVLDDGIGVFVEFVAFDILDAGLAGGCLLTADELSGDFAVFVVGDELAFSESADWFAVWVQFPHVADFDLLAVGAGDFLAIDGGQFVAGGDEVGGLAGFAVEGVFAVVEEVDDAAPDGDVVFVIGYCLVVSVVGSDCCLEASDDAVAFGL